MEGEKHGYYGQTMNRSLPILGGLILLVSGCGGRSSEPSAEQPSLVRELQVKSDYGQIYIYDPHTDSWRDTDTQDNNPLLRALDDASHSRRFVGYDDGFVRRAYAEPIQLERANADRGQRQAATT